MRVLIVGTSGQLAQELRRVPVGHGLELLPAERFDVTDAAAVGRCLDRQQPDLVLNAAAYTAVDKAEAEAPRAFAVNAEGPAFLAAWCARHDAALFHVSTDYVFDGHKATAYVEKDATNPLSVYGASKLAGEERVRSDLPRHLIVRTSWVFSAHGHNFVKTMLRLACERSELRVVCDQVGRPTSAADLARVLWSLATRLAEGSELPWGTYHYASAGATSWHGFAEAIVAEQAASTGHRPKVVAIQSHEYPTPAARPANSTLDTSRIEATFGIQPRPFRDELSAVVRELVTS